MLCFSAHKVEIMCCILKHMAEMGKVKFVLHFYTSIGGDYPIMKPQTTKIFFFKVQTVLLE